MIMVGFKEAELGFQGVIISDDPLIGAIVKGFGL